MGYSGQNEDTVKEKVHDIITQDKSKLQPSEKVSYHNNVDDSIMYV